MKLQRLDMDAMEAYEEIDKTKRDLKDVRKILEQKQQESFKEAD